MTTTGHCWELSGNLMGRKWIWCEGAQQSSPTNVGGNDVYYPPLIINYVDKSKYYSCISNTLLYAFWLLAVVDSAVAYMYSHPGVTFDSHYQPITSSIVFIAGCKCPRERCMQTSPRWPHLGCQHFQITNLSIFHHNLWKDLCCYLTDIKLQLRLSTFVKAKQRNWMVSDKSKLRVDTEEISFICGGAFVELEKTITKMWGLLVASQYWLCLKLFFCEHLDIYVLVDRNICLSPHPCFFTNASK